MVDLIMIYVDNFAKKNSKTNQHKYRADTKTPMTKLEAERKPSTTQTKKLSKIYRTATTNRQLRVVVLGLS
jgi:hypothetical protein